MSLKVFQAPSLQELSMTPRGRWLMINLVTFDLFMDLYFPMLKISLYTVRLSTISVDHANGHVLT